MTDKSRKLEGVKQEIRSILLTQPNGLTITALAKDYKSMIGQDLPTKEFGFASPSDFLRNIPDVVSMNWSSRYNTFVLKAVADETTKHIEKLVSKQKSSKSSISATRRMLVNSAMPPRFSRPQNIYRNPTRPHLPVSLKYEINQVAKEYRNGLSLPNLLTAFRRKFGKDLTYRNFGFYTLEDCLNSIPEVFLRCESGEVRIYPILEGRSVENTTSVYSDSWRTVQNSSVKCNNDNKENLPSNDTSVAATPVSKRPTENKTMDVLDSFTSQDEPSDNGGIDSALREQFKQLMKKHPNGIWVSKFPALLKEFCGHNLDYKKLGYYNLVDLFNELPEIFRIEVLQNCKDDFLLFDATSPTENFRREEVPEDKSPLGRKVSQDIFEVTRNIRLLLQANCEGIDIDDFCNIYEANCDEGLDLKVLGFESLPVFLESIAETVPLKILFSGKVPKVFYKKEPPASSLPVIPKSVEQHLKSPSDIPSDAVVGHAAYKLQKIPKEESDEFFPVYLSNVLDPSHIYIQLRKKDVLTNMDNLMDELERFYYSTESEKYRMPAHYIMSGALCVAQWPGDDRWHRIQIVSVPSNHTVVAFFVDYGTRERISSDNLMFLRKKFMELPAQAIRAHLYRLEPYQDGTWDPRAKHYMLNSFGKTPIMAYLAQKPVGNESLPLVLCDVSGENDVFLNDFLVSECLARYVTDEETAANHNAQVAHGSYSRAEELSAPVYNQKPQISPTPQAPPLAGNAPGNLLQMMSVISTPSVSNFDVQNANNPVLSLLQNFTNGDTSSLHPAVLRQLQQLGISDDMLSKPVAVSPPTQAIENKTVPNHSSASVGLNGRGATIINPQSDYNESDSEVFESDEDIDDDDNPEVNSISKRYVKRINLDDGYDHVHMIVIDDRPYMSSGDITFLLWSNDDPNYVRRKLKSKEITIPNNTVNEVGYEQLFYQLGRFQVKGVKTEVTGKSYITLFPFKNVIDILNIFGHPSVAVRDIIDEELLHFDPTDSFWKTLSEEEFEETPVNSVASRDKESKKCLYEYVASLQALKFRKQTLKNQLYSSTTIPSLGKEIEMNEAQCSEYERKIKELQIKIVSHQRERGFD